MTLSQFMVSPSRTIEPEYPYSASIREFPSQAHRNHEDRHVDCNEQAENDQNEFDELLHDAPFRLREQIGFATFGGECSSLENH